MRIYTFDTTLRDGTQGESVSFSVEDKLMIVQKLDDLGIDYIEGGWPGSNPKDKEFFSRAKDLRLNNARLTAFGSTRFARNRVDEDPNVRELVAAETPVVSIFGKSWDLHTQRALGISEEENLKLIFETVAFLKHHGREVVYDAEHFFDGYNSNSAFALRTLEAAKSAGADVLCLCDTNGGTLPQRIAEIVGIVRERFDGTLGIHTHNDSDVAVANTLSAVEQGITHVQGCINGYGERCGNANLCSIISNLELKLGHTTIGPDRLRNLTATARFIAERANLAIRNDQPYVGTSAFAHKGGVHVAAVRKDSATYEHVQPESIGNRQRVLLSDLSGRGNISYELERRGLADRLNNEQRRKLLEDVKQKEYEGYDFEVADGTFELMTLDVLNPGRPMFELVHFDVHAHGPEESLAYAKLIIKDQNEIRQATGNGHGPVDAIHECFLKLLAHYPEVKKVKLTDYKVRVLDANQKGTAAKVRVLVTWSDGARNWTTVGISDDVIKASCQALLDALRLELMRLEFEAKSSAADTHGYGWAV
jgi:2-isopropylmalate synthase